jgi:hypothetical protein
LCCTAISGLAQCQSLCIARPADRPYASLVIRESQSIANAAERLAANKPVQNEKEARMRELKSEEIDAVTGAGPVVLGTRTPVIPVLPGHGRFPLPDPMPTPVPADSLL